jgi:hypothetical protein
MYRFFPFEVVILNGVKDPLYFVFVFSPQRQGTAALIPL